MRIGRFRKEPGTDVETYTSQKSKVGPLLREWRMQRRRSQMDLALDAGISARHLSFVETGRSKPSTELLLTLVHHLDVPLSDRDQLLLAAGYAPRYTALSFDDHSDSEVDRA
jgi:transcriptional regulator with XRE-family HTH domain